MTEGEFYARMLDANSALINHGDELAFEFTNDEREAIDMLYSTLKKTLELCEAKRLLKWYGII